MPTLDDYLRTNPRIKDILSNPSIGHTEAANRATIMANTRVSESSVRRWRIRNNVSLSTPIAPVEPVAAVREPKVLLYDIETSFQIGGFFGPRYKAHIAKVLEPTYVLGFAWKWLGEDEIKTDYIWDHTLYEVKPKNDLMVVQNWANLIQSADIAVGHNVDAFDNKVMTARAIVHGLPPVNLPQTADTLKIARRTARFDGNKLDELGQLLGYGRKDKTDIDLWWGCMNGDPASMKQMEEYNVRDVDLLEKVYLHLKPYDTLHPNLALIQSRPEACPKCGSEGTLTAQGVKRTRTATYQQFKCSGCLSWVRSRLSERDGKPVYV